MIHIDRKSEIFEVYGDGKEILADITYVVIRMAFTYCEECKAPFSEAVELICDTLKKGATGSVKEFYAEHKKEGNYEQ